VCTVHHQSLSGRMTHQASSSSAAYFLKSVKLKAPLHDTHRTCWTADTATGSLLFTLPRHGVTHHHDPRCNTRMETSANSVNSSSIASTINSDCQPLAMVSAGLCLTGRSPLHCL